MSKSLWKAKNGMSKSVLCRIAAYASDEMDKCKWWQFWKRKRKDRMFEILFNSYIDITRT